MSAPVNYFTISVCATQLCYLYDSHNNINNNNTLRSTMFLRQRLSVIVQRGNAACILGALRPVVSGSYKLFIFTLISNLM